MRLFIPEIGDDLTLTYDWSFVTVCEYRNQSLFDAFEIPVDDRFESGNRWKYIDTRFVLPKDTVLKVDRIYVRKGGGDYSSITFLVSDSPDRRLLTKTKGGTAPKKVRFWVKLKETRNIDFEGY